MLYTLRIFSFAKKSFLSHIGPMSLADDPLSIASDAAAQMPAVDLGAAFGKMVVSLVILIILMLASYWLIKKLIQQRLQKGGGSSAIQILEKRMLSPKTVLYLVQVDQKKILIAESQLEVTRLEGTLNG